MASSISLSNPRNKSRASSNNMNKNGGNQNDQIKRQTNYFVYHNTFAAPNVKVDFIGNTNNDAAPQ